MRLNAILGLVSLSAVCACTSQSQNPTQFVLNGPSDLAFGCTGNTPGEVTKRTFPPASCGPIAPVIVAPDAGVPDAAVGGALPESATPVFLMPEKTPGTLHVAELVNGSADYVDQDPFTPGMNGVVVGRAPGSVAVTSDGCWAVVSNSGSCDLAVIDILRAWLAKPDPVAARAGVLGLPARPGEIARPPSLPAGTFPLPTCDTPTGKVFVAYPSCHLVARVDLATFQVIDGIRFGQGAPPEIVGPDVTCPAECTDTGGAGPAPEDGDAGVGDAGPGGDVAQPVAMAIDPKVAQHLVTSGQVTTTNHGSAASAPIAIQAVDRLYLAYIQVVDNGAAVPTTTVTGAGLTWTQAATVASGANRRRLTLFYATGHSDGTPMTITHSAATADATQWVIEDVLGVNLATPIRQVTSATGTAPNATIALGAFAGEGSGTVAAYGVDVRDEARSDPPVRQVVNPAVGWTEISAIASLTNDAGTLEAQFIGGPLSPGAAWQRNSTYVAITAELDLLSTLYIGAWDSGRLVIADLDVTGAPVALREVALEGATGVRRLAASGLTSMGTNGAAGEFNFVYAIADDQSIHVVDTTTGRTPAECDTQIDRRYLHSVASARRLACFHLGDPSNPPRRPEAKGPGIVLPAGVLPLDVTITQAFASPRTIPAPDSLNGKFAAVIALGPTTNPPRGVVYWINVNDDDYPDIQPGIDLGDPDIVFGLPHSVRDNVPFRWQPSRSCVEENYPNDDGPYRIATGYPLFSTTLPTNVNGAPGAEFAPNLHRVMAQKIVSTGVSSKMDVCEGSGTVVYELSQIAPQDLRSELWTDASLVSVTEAFTFTWEGALAPEDFRSRKSGGRVSLVPGGRMQIDVAGANLCSLGPQPGDIGRLLGCTGSSDCAIDEICYIHPEAPAGLDGMCVPTDKVLEFSADCQPLLTTRRRYSIVEVADGHVVIATRPKTLPETPIDGCISTPQCEAIQEAVLSAREDAAAQPRGTLARHAFACATDAIMGGPPRCIETCDGQNACEAGSTCEAGRCVLGPLPAAKCVSPLQRYELRAGDAFTVLSSTAGYRHRGTMDPVTKACVVDPAKSPLLVSRFGRNEPPCDDTGVTGVSPNPCTLPPAIIDTNDCTHVLSGFAEPILVNNKLCYRPTHAVRIRTPGLSFDVVDLSLPLEGFPDVRYSPIQFGHAFQIQVAGGGSPFIESAVLANLPTRVRRGLNGEPWVVDSGDSGVQGGTQGQIILLTGSPSPTAQSAVRLF